MGGKEMEMVGKEMVGREMVGCYAFISHAFMTPSGSADLKDIKYHQIRHLKI